MIFTARLLRLRSTIRSRRRAPTSQRITNCAPLVTVVAPLVRDTDYMSPRSADRIRVLAISPASASPYYSCCTGGEFGSEGPVGVSP